jgi:hypothetical protein
LYLANPKNKKTISVGIYRVSVEFPGRTFLRLQTAGLTAILAGLTFGVLVWYFFYSWSFAVLTNRVFRALTALSYPTIFLMLLGVIASLVGVRQILHAQRGIAHENAPQTSISVLARIIGESKYKSASILAAIGYDLSCATVSA